MTDDKQIDEALRDFQLNPSYENRAVAFYDFLGWRSKIAEAGNDPRKIGDLRRMILRNSRSLGGIQKHASPGVRFSTFSDNIVVSCEPERDAVLHLMTTLGSFQLAGLAGGFLIRGGLTVGPIYHDNVSVFGPALNRAYELESQIANVPRIVVDDQIRNIVGRNIYFINCSEDVCFIDPFSIEFMNVLKLIEGADAPTYKDVYSKLGFPSTGAQTLRSLSVDQFFGTPLSGIKPLIRRPLHDKEWNKIAWVYDRLARLLGVPPASSYPRVPFTEGGIQQER
jgi:hypothetical protein